MTGSVLVPAAGHQTTANFFTNTLLALMTHPETLAAVRAGQRSWEQAAEESLRWGIRL